jgi:acyl-CoA hydrolase
MEVALLAPMRREYGLHQEKTMKKKVSESAVEDSPYRIFPNDLNPLGTVFGGLVMSLCDRIASVVAEAHSEKACVTASVDAMNFLAPADKGEILLVSSAVNRTWRSSMEIGVKVHVVNFCTSHRAHILSAYFTFVALDEHKRPTEVPAVEPITAVERRRYEEAEHRRQARMQFALQQKKRREDIAYTQDNEY